MAQLSRRELRLSRAQLQPCRRATRSKRRESLSIGLRLASWLTAGRFLICLSPSAPTVGSHRFVRPQSSEARTKGVQEDGVWVQRPICLSREAIDASFTSAHELSFSILTLDAPQSSICRKAQATIRVNRCWRLSRRSAHLTSAVEKQAMARLL